MEVYNNENNNTALDFTTYNRTANVITSYECEYYHPVYDDRILASSSTKTLEVNGEEVMFHCFSWSQSIHNTVKTVHCNERNVVLLELSQYKNDDWMRVVENFLALKLTPFFLSQCRWVKKGCNFKTGKFFKCPEPFLYSLYSSVEPLNLFCDTLLQWYTVFHSYVVNIAKKRQHFAIAENFWIIDHGFVVSDSSVKCIHQNQIAPLFHFSFFKIENLLVIQRGIKIFACVSNFKHID